MGELNWPDWALDVAGRVRRAPGDDFWESAENVVDTLTTEELRYFAVVGLAELGIQSHRIDRDRTEPCIGDQLARIALGLPPREHSTD